MEWWEALITLLMFPGLVQISYMADAGWFRKKKVVPTEDGDDPDINAVESFIPQRSSLTGPRAHRPSLTGSEASHILKRKGLKKMTTKAAIAYLTKKIQPRSR